jgi:hypothetical protein
VPAIAFGIGLTFGVTFDTAGRRAPAARAEVEPDQLRYVGPPAASTSDADEPTVAERRAVAAGAVDRDGDGVDDREEAYAGTDRPRRGFLRR